jgi:hypothetical protein
LDESEKTTEKGVLPMAMHVEIKGIKIYIEIDLEKPTPSASGKTLVAASTRGMPILLPLKAANP